MIGFNKGEKMRYLGRFTLMLGFVGSLIILMIAVCAPGWARDEDGKRDQSERNLERQKRFLFRAVGDLDGSLSYVSEIIKGLDKQIDNIQLLESPRREKDLRALQDWYYKYADRIGEYRTQFDLDLTTAFSGGTAPQAWTEHYDTIAREYELFAKELQDILTLLDYDRSVVDKNISDMRARINYLNDISEREKEYQDKERHDTEKDRRDHDRSDKEGDEKAKERRTLEIGRLTGQIQSFENLLLHLDIIIELGKFEQAWISLRVADYAALNDAAHAIEKSGRSSRESAYAMIIRNYESGITFSRRKIEEIDRKIAKITRTGTLQTLERLDELSEYYSKMKHRYELHMTWLSQQIGAYRAEQTGI